MRKRLSLIFNCDDFTSADKDKCLSGVIEMIVSILFFSVKINYKDEILSDVKKMSPIMKTVLCFYGLINVNDDHEMRIEKKLNELCQEQLGEKITHIDVISPKLGWDYVKSVMNRDDNNVILSLTTSSHIRGYGSNLESYINKNEGFLFFVDVYLGCSSVLKNLKANNSENHILVYTDQHHIIHKYETIYDCIYVKKRFDTITFIVDNHNNDYQLIGFNIESRKASVYLAKDAESLLEKYESIQNWLGTFFFKPNCYFSYASKSKYRELMTEINKKVNHYFPFLHFQQDNDGDKAFTNINEYVKKLINGDFIVVLVDYEYLTSFNCMYELACIIKNELEKSKSIEDLVDKLAKKGCFILIDRDNAEVSEAIFNSESRTLEDYWKNQLSCNKEYSFERIMELVNSFGKIKELLSSINSIHSINRHHENNFVNLISKINYALACRPFYVDIYDGHSPWEKR